MGDPPTTLPADGCRMLSTGGVMSLVELVNDRVALALALPALSEMRTTSVCAPGASGAELGTAYVAPVAVVVKLLVMVTPSSLATKLAGLMPEEGAASEKATVRVGVDVVSAPAAGWVMVATGATRSTVTDPLELAVVARSDSYTWDRICVRRMSRP